MLWQCQCTVTTDKGGQWLLHRILVILKLLWYVFKCDNSCLMVIRAWTQRTLRFSGWADMIGVVRHSVHVYVT